MTFRGMIAGGAVVLTALAMTSAAGFAHAATPTNHSPSKAPLQVNLSSEFKAALKSEAGRVFPRAGIVRPVGFHTPKLSLPTTCKEPNCNLWYHGGFIQSHPSVYLVFWGPKWLWPKYAPDAAYLTNLYRGLGTASDNWSTTLTQYNGKDGQPGFGTSVLKKALYDKSAPPATVGAVQLAAEAEAVATANHINGYNAQVVIASQSGTCFSDGFAGSCGHLQSPAFYCAWHSATAPAGAHGVAFINFPFQLDAGVDCGENWIPNTPLTGFSIVGGHEFAEAVTDPFPLKGTNFAWLDEQDHISGGEVADKCAWGGHNWGSNDPIGPVTLSTGQFVMQSLWSNAAHACVM